MNSPLRLGNPSRWQRGGATGSMQEARGRQRMVATHSTAGAGRRGAARSQPCSCWEDGGVQHAGVLCGGCEHREPHPREVCGGWKRGR